MVVLLSIIVFFLCVIGCLAHTRELLHTSPITLHCHQSHLDPVADTHKPLHTCHITTR
jgi:hypothetical protein